MNGRPLNDRERTMIAHAARWTPPVDRLRAMACAFGLAERARFDQEWSAPALEEAIETALVAASAYNDWC